MKPLDTFCALSIFVFGSLTVHAQTATMSTSGNWATATNWSGSNIGNSVSETVTISNNVNPTISSGAYFNVGNTTLNNDVTLTINSTGHLEIGASGNPKNLTTNNNANLSIAGTLTIWGNLVVNNNINFTVSGTVIVKGNVTLSNNANMSVSGNFQVLGNFTAGNNTNVNLSGTASVSGNINVGNGSNLNGCVGCFSLGGSCTGPNSFCGKNTLPVLLKSFHGNQNSASIELNWITLMENKFDKYLIERSADGMLYERLGEVQGSGIDWSSLEKSYGFTDEQPYLGINYYRLVALDLDGQLEYFDAIAVSYQNNAGFSIYPNPSNGATIKIVFPGEVAATDRLIIYDRSGLEILVITGPDRETELGGLVQLSKGVYIVKYQRKTQTATEQLVIR